MSYPKPTRVPEAGAGSAIAKAVLIEQTHRMHKFKHAFVHLCRKPLENGDDPVKDPNFRVTDGLYYLEWRPVVRMGGIYRKKAFVIRADVLKKPGDTFGIMRVGSWSDLRSSKDPWAKWLLENTNISARLFSLAARNNGTHIPFCFDIAKYSAGRGADRFTPRALEFANKMADKAELDGKRLSAR